MNSDFALQLLVDKKTYQRTTSLDKKIITHFLNMYVALDDKPLALILYEHKYNLTSIIKAAWFKKKFNEPLNSLEKKTILVIIEEFYSLLPNEI